MGHSISKYLKFSFLLIKTSINKFLLIETRCLKGKIGLFLFTLYELNIDVAKTLIWAHCAPHSA